MISQRVKDFLSYILLALLIILFVLLLAYIIGPPFFGCPQTDPGCQNITNGSG